MQLSRLPPTLLLGLGLAAAISCRMRPCLSVLPPEVGPCLSVDEPIEPPDEGASVDEAARDETAGDEAAGDEGDDEAGAGSQPDEPDAAPELADASIERVLQSGALPVDVVARLRQRQ